jgi:polyphosphate kinase
VRLEVEEGADPDIIDRLRVNFEVDESQVVRTDGPVNLSRVMTLYTDTPRPDLKYPTFVPRELRMNRRSANIFDEIRHRDILLHHPYDSYDGVVSLDEADALSHLSGLAYVHRADRSRTVEGSDGRGRIDGAFRRGVEHSMGP